MYTPDTVGDGVFLSGWVLLVSVLFSRWSAIVSRRLPATTSNSPSRLRRMASSKSDSSDATNPRSEVTIEIVKKGNLMIDSAMKRVYIIYHHPCYHHLQPPYSTIIPVIIIIHVIIIIINHVITIIIYP